MRYHSIIKYENDFMKLMMDVWGEDIKDNGWLWYSTSPGRGVWVSNEPDGYWNQFADMEVMGACKSFPVPQWIWEISGEGLWYLTIKTMPENCYESPL